MHRQPFSSTLIGLPRLVLGLIVVSTLLLNGLPAASAQPVQAITADPPQLETAGQPSAGTGSPPELLPGISADWWSAAQEEIHQSEYSVTWQEHTYLPGSAAAYQAPNRAHNLRTYFTPEGPIIIPRIWPKGADAPPWRWGLRLATWGYEGAPEPAGVPALHPQKNHVEYRYPDQSKIVELYINDETGLRQELTLTPPLPLPEETGGDNRGRLVLDLSLSGSLIPGLVADGTEVELKTGDGVPVLRYALLSTTGAGGWPLASHLELVGQRLRLVVERDRAAYPLTITARLQSITAGAVAAAAPEGLSPTANWQAECDQAEAHFGISVSTAGDVNGDGYADLVVGAADYDNGQIDEGAAFVYYGSASGLSPTANWTAEGDQNGARLGISVGTAGDVNGDGYADLVAGARGYDNAQVDEGRAFVYHGSAGGLSLNANWTAESDQGDAWFGASVGTAGDVNGDGYADLVVGAVRYDNGQTDEGRAYVYHGSALGLSQTANWTAEGDQGSAWYGASVGTAGDVNGDGYADLVVGAPYYGNGQTYEGRAYIYHGSTWGLSLTADWTAESDQENALLGISVSTAGDVNGDGYADLAVGASGYGNDHAGEGRAFVYHGSASGLSLAANWEAECDQEYAHFGYSAGTAGDVNGDGYADVVVGAYGYGNDHEDEGRAYVYHGSAAGLSLAANWEAECDQEYALFGASVGTAGDVNGDGYADVVVGAYGYETDHADEGRAFAYHGSASSLTVGAADWIAGGDQTGAHLGYSVGTAGDVNADGYADLVVGAPYYDNGQTDEGRAYVYHGSAAGPSPSANWMAESDQNNAYLGYSVGTAGDVNGDGYADIIVGACRYENGQWHEGRAYVYYGSADGPSPSADWTTESDQIGAEFGTFVGTAGDVNGDGYADIAVGAPGYANGQGSEGRAFVYHGSAAGLTVGAANWTAESDQAGATFGYSVNTAGDVNGDGYADLIVGAPYYDNGQTNEGRTYVYQGSAHGLSLTANWTAESDQGDAYFGYSAGTAGDVNGDGYADVIVGARYYSNGEAGEGRAYVYHGLAAGLNPTANWMVESNQAGANLGVSVGTAGDVNGDGYADVVIGADEYDNGQGSEGRAYVYHGSASGLTVEIANWTAESDQDGALLGFSVGTAGDVNGDGYADVIVGAPVCNGCMPDDERAYVYYGNGGDGLDLRPRQMRSDDSAHVAPLGKSDRPVAVRLHLTGRMPLGREKVKLQWQVAPLGMPFTSPSIISGSSTDWIDTLTTGVVISQKVDNLTYPTAYHWRVRLLYWPGNRLGQPASRWVHIPWNGWNEQDFRTLPFRSYLPIILRNY